MQPGVEVEPSKNQKDQLELWGNSLENVSQSAADIQQICRVRNKDIRKVRTYTMNYGPQAPYFMRCLGLLNFGKNFTNLGEIVLGWSVRVGEGQR